MRCLILLLALTLTACSRPDTRLARQIHQLCQQGNLPQAQESLATAFRQFPESLSLRQERLYLNLLAGQPELAAAEASQILQANPSAQPYRQPLHDSSPAIRALAIRAIALHPPTRPPPASLLTTALQDSDPTVRRAALEATQILSTSEALPLLRQASKDSDWLTRAAAARLFGSRADPSAIPTLFSMLSDRDSYVRRFARRSLLELATRSTPNAYLPALQSKDRTTQVVAALALARLNDGHGLDILLAYAITIHKSQGSEFQVVVMPLDTSHFMMLKRNLVYTGITRAKKLMIMIGSKKAAWMAVQDTQVAERYSRLKDWLVLPAQIEIEDI